MSERNCTITGEKVETAKCQGLVFFYIALVGLNMFQGKKRRRKTVNLDRIKSHILTCAISNVMNGHE